MSNQDQNHAEFLAKQHQYAREKEKADKVIARYDLMAKAVLGFLGGIIGLPALLMLAFGAMIPGIITLLVGGGILFAIYRAIKKRKEGHQAKLDAQMMSNLKS